MTMAIRHQVSPAEMKTMYLQDGETYETVGKKLDVSASTVCALVKPLLTDAEREAKKHAPKMPRVPKTVVTPVVSYQPPVDGPMPSMRERMMQRDRELGRKPDFGGMKLEAETHIYNLKGTVGLYKVDVLNKTIDILQSDSDTSAIEGTLKAQDIAALIDELQTLRNLLG